MQLPSVFRSYRAKIDQELRALLADLDSPLYDMLRYQLGWIDAQGNPRPQPTGKALRPTLCLLTSESLCGDIRPALPAAAAIELVHNFSLIHDDVQDGDRRRRNRPTVWAVWGKPQAINAGTAMRVLASLSMLRLGDQGLAPEKLLHAQRILDQSCLRLIEGQYLDISFESRTGVRVAEYLSMIEGKTAALIACSFELGAMLVTEDEGAIQAFRNCGLNLGLAFQIMDDLLGIWGDKDKTGKPVGSDIQRKKKTYPIVYAWDVAHSRARAEIEAFYRRKTVDRSGRETLLGILDDLQAKEHTYAMVNAYSDRARADLDRVILPERARERFAEVIAFLTEREF